MLKKTIILSLLAVSCLGLTAQGLFESATTSSDNEDENKKTYALGGYVRGSAYGGSANYDYTNVFGEFALNGRLSKGKTFFYGEVRFLNGLFFDQNETIVDLTEAYAGYQSKYFSIYLGNQIISWGRTDGFNPTNNITPKDYFFLTPEIDDQLLSNFMLRTKINFKPEIDLELITIPFFKESVYRYDLFQISDEARFYEAKPTEKTIENSSFAARLNFNLPAAGFSFSYFHGYDPFYGFKINDIMLFPSMRIYYIPDFYKKNTFGADFELPIQKTIIRAEAAFNLTKNYRNSMHIPNPDISYVVGLENNFNGYIAILQYIGKYTFDYSALDEPSMPNSQEQSALIQYAYDMINYESELFNRKIFGQQEKTNHAVMLSINKFFAHDIMNARLSGYYNITTAEYLVRPELIWNITDGLTAIIGAHLMFGPEESIFNHSGSVLNGGFLSLKASF
jgi:hypothetical protein